MKRHLVVAMVIALVLVIGLVGCSSSNGGNNNPSQTGNTGGQSTDNGSASPEETKITYWTFDRHDAEYMKDKVNEFNETNGEGIEVEINVMAEDYNQSLEIAFTSGQAPDVFRARPSNIPSFYNKDFMEPLNDYLSEEQHEKFGTSFIEQVNQMDGQIFSLPNYAFTSRLIYNVDLFEKAGIETPPTTLDEMVDVAKKLAEAGKDEGAYGFGINFKNPMNAYDKSFKIIAQLSGYGGYGYDFNAGQFDFTTHKPMVEAFRQMNLDDSMMPGVEALDIDPLRAQFAEGKVGMYMSLSAEVGVFQDQFPAKIRWDSAPIPTYDGNITGASDMLNGGTWLVMNKNSEHKDAAWSFMEFMYSDGTLTDYYETGQGITLVAHVLDTANEPTTENIAGFLPNPYDALWPVSPAVNPDGHSFADVYVRYYLEGGDLDSMLADLNKRYNDALDKGKADGTITAEPDPNFDPINLQGTVAQ